MMRNIFMLFGLAVVLVSGLAACNEKAAPSIAVVDAEKVFQDSKLAQEGMAYLEGVGKQFNDRLTEMQSAIAANPEDEAQVANFQTELMALQQDFEAKQAAAADKLNKLFDATVEEYRLKNNLEVILPKQIIVAVRSGADVTAEVIKLLDSKTLDYGAGDMAPAPAAAPAESPVEPAPAAGETK